MYSKDDIYKLKSSIDYINVLTILGFELSKSSGKFIRAACAVHNGDNPTSFSFNTDTGTWVCFSHKCHEIYGNDIISLVSHIKGLNFVESVEFLKDFSSSDISISNSVYINKVNNEFINLCSKNKLPDIVSEENLNLFKHLRSKFFNKKDNGGFSNSTLDYYEVGGGYIDARGVSRDVIPIRDVNGRLKGYSFRDISNVNVSSYKYLLTENFNKNSILYNLNNAKKYVDDYLIVVEGFKDVWRLCECGYPNAVAIMGSNTTKGQDELLKIFVQKGIILFLDGDKAGIRGTEIIYNKLYKYFKVIPVYITDANKDPSDLSCYDINRYVGVYYDR